MLDEAEEMDPTNKSDNEPTTVDLSQEADSQKADSQNADSQGAEVASENSIESVDSTVDESANQAVTPEEAFFVAKTTAYPYHEITTAAFVTQPRQTRNRWRNKFQRGRQNRRQRNRRNRRRQQLRNGQQAANTGRWQTGLAALLSKPLLLSGRTRDVNEKEGDEDLSFTSKLRADVQDDIGLALKRNGHSASTVDRGLRLGTVGGDTYAARKQLLTAADRRR